MISKKGMAIKMMTLFILLASMILYTEGKGNRLDARFMKTRTATQFKKVLSFSVSDCASFSITNVQPYTSCPFTTDSSTSIDYFCESNIAYVIASSQPADFTAQIVGDVTSSCAIGDYSNSCGFFHTLKKTDEVTCGTDYCTTSPLVTGCSSGGGVKAYRDNFVYFAASDPSNPSCKETDDTCCSSLAPLCPAPSNCPNDVYDSFIQTGVVGSSVPVLTLTFLKPVTVTGYKYKITSLKGVPTGTITFTIGGTPYALPLPTSTLGDNSITLNAPFPLTASSIDVTLACTNCDGSAVDFQLATFTTPPTDPTNTITYTTGNVIGYPILSDPAC